MGLGSDVYKGAAQVGRIYTTIGLIVGIIVFCVLIGGGIYFVVKKPIYTDTVYGKINTVDCQHHQDEKNNIRYTCTLNVSYIVNDAVHTRNFKVDSDTDYKGQQRIEVFYNPLHPDDAIIQKDNSKMMGGIMIGLAILVLLISYFSFYMSRRYQFYAAGRGVGAIVDMF